MGKIIIEVDVNDPRQVLAAKELIDAKHAFALGRVQEQAVPQRTVAEDAPAPSEKTTEPEAQADEVPATSAPVDAAESVSIDDLRKLIIAAAPTQKPTILAKLKELGASRLPELDESKFAEFAAFLTSL